MVLGDLPEYSAARMQAGGCGTVMELDILAGLCGHRYKQNFHHRRLRRSIVAFIDNIVQVQRAYIVIHLIALLNSDNYVRQR